VGAYQRPAAGADHVAGAGRDYTRGAVAEYVARAGRDYTRGAVAENGRERRGANHPRTVLVDQCAAIVAHDVVDPVNEDMLAVEARAVIADEPSSHEFDEADPDQVEARRQRGRYLKLYWVDQ